MGISQKVESPVLSRPIRHLIDLSGFNYKKKKRQRQRQNFPGLEMVIAEVCQTFERKSFGVLQLITICS